MIGKIGGNGGASIVGFKAQITSSGAAWSEPNPNANQPAGIICAKFGLTAVKPKANTTLANKRVN